MSLAHSSWEGVQDQCRFTNIHFNRAERALKKMATWPPKITEYSTRLSGPKKQCFCRAKCASACLVLHFKHVLQNY